ncbi:hypothetical protein [Segatella copri]|uniref:hypothetical protein n=1 Tax=Segatella copri TaxID=165179 RepID=UPI003F888AC4
MKGEDLNCRKFAPTRPEGAEAPSPGHSPWVNQQSTLRPVRAKALKIQTLKAPPSQFHEEDAFNKFNHSYQNILSPKRELNSCLRVFERLQPAYLLLVDYQYYTL